MSTFAPEYVEVAERISQFYTLHPDGRIVTDVIEITDTRVTVRAAVYRNVGDTDPAGVGHSWLGVPGTTSFTKGSELENAETSAVGRAIVNAGIPSKKVASADEVRAKGGTPPSLVPKAQQAAPVAAGTWAEGQAHQDDHKPLRARQNGSLFCPTKLENGSWCNWKWQAPVAPAPGEPPAMSDNELASLADLAF